MSDDSGLKFGRDYLLGELCRDPILDERMAAWVAENKDGAGRVPRAVIATTTTQDGAQR